MSFHSPSIIHRQRKLAASAFTPKRIKGYARRMAVVTAAGLDRWAGTAGPHARVDLHAEMSRLTMEVVADVLFGASVDVASFKGLDVSKRPPTAKCRDATNALGNICITPTGKKTVQSKVHEVVCRSSTEGTKPTLDAHALTVHIDPDKGVNGSWKSALETTL